MEKILITGTAGFIGFHLVQRLLHSEYQIIGLDNINEYYDVRLKLDRLNEHGIREEEIIENKLVQSTLFPNYLFIKADLTNHNFIVDFVTKHSFKKIVHLAAQAGVRYSLQNPDAYVKSNVNGFLSILEGARYSNVENFIYASTSSVYGLNMKMPLDETMTTEHPLTIYSATKKANEMIAHSYSHLFKLPTTGLRFFTVYGPWGRPDMALFKFTDAIMKGHPIDVYNNGQMVRDFTYVTDIVESIYRLLSIPSTSNPNWDAYNPEICSSSAPFRLLNIGNSSPVLLLDYINQIEKVLGKSAIKNLLPFQPGDVPSTHADTSRLEQLIHFKPKTSIEEGVTNFINWYKEYFKFQYL